jgi:predicted GNAT family acetyltransferase
MSEILRTSCVCGWESTGNEDEVVAATLDHGLRVHNMAGTREEVLERAERLPHDPPTRATADASDLVVVDVPESRRYDARIGSETVGFSEYQLKDGTITFLHTEVDPDMEGRGFGSRLAAAVLDDARSRGLEIGAKCPFISAYVRRHRDTYPDVALDADQRTSASAS